MPTYIKTGFWEKLKQGSKEWLNLDNLITKIISETPSTGVQSVTGYGVDNTDPLNPIVNKYTSEIATATGTDLATAYLINKTSTIIDSAPSGTGVKLPASPSLNDTYSIGLDTASAGLIVYGNGSFITANTTATTYVIPQINAYYLFRYTGTGWQVYQEQVAPYKVYSALLTNSSGTVTAIQLQNTIGNGSGDGTNDIAWTNPSNGIIRGTMSAGTPFPTNKTWAVSPTLDQSSNAYFVGNKPYNFAPNNSYDFVIRLHDNTQSSTPNFTNLSIEIRVYN